MLPPKQTRKAAARAQALASGTRDTGRLQRECRRRLLVSANFYPIAGVSLAGSASRAAGTGFSRTQITVTLSAPQKIEYSKTTSARHREAMPSMHLRDIDIGPGRETTLART